MRLFVWDIWKSKPASNLRLSPAFHSSSNFKCCLSIFCIQHFKSINSPILLAPHSLCKHRLICVSGTIRKIVLFCSVLSLPDITWCVMHLSCNRSMHELFYKDAFLRSSNYCTHYWWAACWGLNSEGFQLPDQVFSSLLSWDSSVFGASCIINTSVL